MTDSIRAPLFQLVYVSDVALAAALTLAATLRDILLTSHRLNEQAGVTGLLVSNGVWFAQVLEGEETQVRACYARLEKDPRHVSPTIRLLRPLEAREYSRWSMCGVTLSPLEDDLLGAPDLGLNVRQAPSGALTEMLRRVADRRGEELDLLHADIGAEAAAMRDWALGGGPPRWA